jgi:uncharacterized protein YyaL (SSP411 family)
MNEREPSHDDTAPTNRLAGESSPYLLLHRHNPVDWYPWSEEALAAAREQDRPIFLSVGYSTCYWCHVMERESFSNPEIARFMNDHFVNVKVDREERPDLDEIYMAATQILSGQGGWPNSVFLTPDLKPFYAGTYFPPREMHGRPGFPQVLAGLSDAWKSRRDDVRVQADEVAQAMRRVLEERFAPGDALPAAGAAEGALVGLRQTYDEEHGGFGSAPKFPTPSNLYLLHELAAGEGTGEGEGEAEAARLLTGTLDAMARGGIYDQLGGGFHRYSTDARWLVPHFEKMLYDNGALLELYALEHERTGDPEAERIVRETAAFLEREMTLPGGAFASAIDAETDGREGAFYVWTADELRAVLGEEDFAFLAPILGFDRDPFFRDPHAPDAEPAYVLHLPEPLAGQAARRRTTREELLGEVRPLMDRLFEARAGRDRPLTDDKVLADWNGLAIRGLAVAGRVLGDDGMTGLARRAADRVLETMRPAGGPLLHAVRNGEGRITAYLADYACLVRGLLGLHETTGDERHLTAAVELATEQEERLAHPDGGWYNAAGAPDLLFRSQEIFDGATPAANAVAVLDALELADRTGEGAWRDRAERALTAFSPVIERAPEAVRMLSVAAHRIHRGAGGGVQRRDGGAGARPQGPAAASEAGSVVEHELVLSGPAEPEESDEGGARPFELRLTVAPGWHLNANPASAEGLQPTAVTAEAGAELVDVRYPEGEEWTPDFTDDRLSVYTGTVAITGTVRGKGRLVLTYQPCERTRCLQTVRREIALG